MKNVMVLLHEDAGQEARLQVALDVTRALGGHLMCLDVCPPPPPSPYSMVDAEVLLFDDLQARERVNRAHIERRLSREDVPSSMTFMTGAMAECILDQAQLADLIVLNRELDDLIAPNMLAIASDVVNKVHKPIMAVPEGSRGFRAAGTALIAWDGSPSAAAALSSSIPLVSLASSALIVEVARSGSSTVEDAAKYLSRHGIEPELCLIPPEGSGPRSIVEKLQDVCRDRAADYMVMGAYGHSIIREALFGGVTRTILKSSPVPVLLAH